MTREYLKPPVQDKTLIGWLKKNLFSSIFNSILTIIVTFVVLMIINSLFQWGVVNATFVGGKYACDANLEYVRASRSFDTELTPQERASALEAIKNGSTNAALEKALALPQVPAMITSQNAYADSLAKAGVNPNSYSAAKVMSSQELTNLAIQDAGGVDTGACWPFVSANFKKFMFGFYPSEHRWRPILAGALILWTLLLLLPRPSATVSIALGAGAALLSIAEILMNYSPTAGSLPYTGFFSTIGATLSGLFSGEGSTTFYGVFVYAIAAIALFYQPLDKYKVKIAMFLIIGCPIIALILLNGVGPMTSVPTTAWGGLTLTLVLACIGVIGAFPLGILLALGRRSELPIIKSFCVAFIEFWRGAPLITVIIIATLMIPLFLPDGINFNVLIYVIIGIIMFQAAYIAEVVRSGLQAVAKGQYEAGMAMGLTYWQSMRKIILPQALRISIPGIINQFISLFKDTSLVYVVSLYDLFTTFYKSAVSDIAWLGSYKLEGFAFIILVYWVFCYGMSIASQKYEQHLNAKTTH